MKLTVPVFFSVAKQPLCFSEKRGIAKIKVSTLFQFERPWSQFVKDRDHPLCFQDETSRLNNTSSNTTIRGRAG